VELKALGKLRALTEQNRDGASYDSGQPLSLQPDVAVSSLGRVPEPPNSKN